MPTLLELQQSFAAALLSGDDSAIAPHIVEEAFTAAERLRVYRNSWRSVVAEALRLTYPAVDRLVGRDFFDGAAEAFVITRPPRSGYLNEYGAEFAAFLETFPPAATLPYLADVARFEWALTAAANAPDAATLDLAALAAIAPEHHAGVRFAPHPSVRLLALRYPADQVADAVLAGDAEAMAAVDLSSGPVWLVVHRGSDGVAAQRVGADCFGVISQLCAGTALGEILRSNAPECATILADQLARGRLAAFWTGAAAGSDPGARPG